MNEISPDDPKNSLNSSEIANLAGELGIGARRSVSSLVLSGIVPSASPDKPKKPLESIGELKPIARGKSSSILTPPYELKTWGMKCPCLQRFHNSIYYLIFYCIVIFLQSMVVNGFINASIASLEKRYGLTSTESSLIPSMYDIGCICVVLPVSYFGSRGHKPKWVGLGALVMCLGCVLFTLPQLLNPAYSYKDRIKLEHILCSVDNHFKEMCSENKEFHLRNFKYMFYIGMFIIGIGSAPIYTLGVAYIEENVNKETSALYIGISTAIAAVGPAIGYILLGSFLNIYVDLTTSDTSMVTENTDIWVGAWWLGFALASIGFLVISCFLTFYPEVHIIKPQNIEKENETAQQGNKTEQSIKFIKNTDSAVTQDGTTTSMKAPRTIRDFVSITMQDLFNMFGMVKNMFTNLTYLCLNLATALTFLSLSGISTYGPKFIEKIYGLTAGQATITTGLISVPTLALGALMGGILLNRYGWKLSGTLTFMAVTTVISVPLSTAFLLMCNVPDMIGISAPYIPGTSFTPGNFNSFCNSNCSCNPSRQFFSPVCANKYNYYSPCFAGCTNYTEAEDKSTIYTHCQCVRFIDNSTQALDRQCRLTNCNSFYMFLILIGMYLFITYLRGAPMVTATMRSVKRREISLALGFQSIFSRVCGSIPGPILFGYLMDTVCLHWEIQCGSQTNCNHYNRPRLSFNVFMLTIVITCVNALVYCIPRISLGVRSNKRRAAKSKPP